MIFPFFSEIHPHLSTLKCELDVNQSNYLNFCKLPGARVKLDDNVTTSISGNLEPVSSIPDTYFR